MDFEHGAWVNIIEDAETDMFGVEYLWLDITEGA